MENKEKRTKEMYSIRNLSAFCLQVSLLLSAGVPLEEGFLVMEEDGESSEEKELLRFLSEESELGVPLYKAMEKTEAFPSYVVKMAKLGQETGTLDKIMKFLAGYYEKEDQLMKNIKNTLTYPVMMIFMLFVVLFVLFTKVMPVFEGVYEQLGAQLSPISKTAIHLGGIFSGMALILFAASVLAALVMAFGRKKGKSFRFVEKTLERLKRNSKIARFTAVRRFSSVLAVTLESGMEMETGMELAKELVENPDIEEKLQECARDLEWGSSFYEALKKTGLFSGFYIQMIQVGERSGNLAQVMETISEDYGKEADNQIDNILARFEPVMVAVLAAAVGLVLLSVMLPLAGVLSAIG